MDNSKEEGAELVDLTGVLIITVLDSGLVNPGLIKFAVETETGHCTPISYTISGPYRKGRTVGVSFEDKEDAVIRWAREMKKEFFKTADTIVVERNLDVIRRFKGGQNPILNSFPPIIKATASPYCKVVCLNPERVKKLIPFFDKAAKKAGKTSWRKNKKAVLARYGHLLKRFDLPNNHNLADCFGLLEAHCKIEKINIDLFSL